MKYDAILFDIDGTLFEYVQPFERIWQARLAERGFTSTSEVILKAFVDATEQVVGRDPLVSNEFEAYREKWMEICLRALRNLGFGGDSSEAAESMWQGLVIEKSRPYPEVAATLGELRSKALQLGVVSNYNITLEEALRAHGLRDYFQVVVPSAVVGVEKPDPHIFAYALERLGVPSNRALFVGDSYEKDVLGARAAGMDAVLIIRNGAGDSRDAVSIRTLTDILELV